MSDPLSVIGVVLAEKFRVERLLGEGGFGVVYAGTHLLLNEPVAIKFLKVDSADTTRAAGEFAREARILFSLSHPAIVRMYDVGELPRGASRMPWVVLELLVGPTLDEEISERRAYGRMFSAMDLRQIFDPILDGLAFAHARGVAHRDLKPSNILLSRSSTQKLEPKLLDFGTARSQSAAFQASAGRTGFTPLYAAPEQWDPSISQPTFATDVYAMGLTLLECATLQRAFDGTEHITTLMRAVMSGTGRPSLARVRPDLAPQLHAVIERAIAVQPSARYRDGGELRAAVQHALAHVSPSAATVPQPMYGSSPPMMMTAPFVSHASNSPVRTTSPFVAAQPTRPAPGMSAPGGAALVIAVVALVVVVGAVAAGVFYVRSFPTATNAANGHISKPIVRPNENFAMADAAKVAQQHQREIEECAVKSDKWSGQIDVVIEVSCGDGHVIGSSCNTVWQKHDSKNPSIDPRAQDFCACTQTVVPNWKFKPPKADVVTPFFDDTQSLHVIYTATPN